MKFALICFYLTTLHVFATLYSQATKVTINLKNSTIYEVLKVIEEQTEYKFLYHDALIDPDKIISVDFKDQTIKQVMDNIFFGSDNTYTLLENNLIVITPKTKPIKQEIIIKGKVTDATGEDMPGVGIVIKGTNTATTTNDEGLYQLSISETGTVLVFSMIGYLSREVTVVDKRVIDISLNESIESLSQVVVVGYGKTKKSDLTGSVSTISSNQIKDKPVSSIDMAMQGKVAGVEITSNSGSPGSTTAIRIRGIGTITNSDPIFVIDGIIMEANTVDFLNTNDIDNISVLKDASATAIYGAKGANGVIMITTKKGKKGDAKVNFNAYYGTQKASHWMDMMSGPEWAATKHIVYPNNRSYNPDTTVSTNWFDKISHRAPMYNANLSLSGGNDNSTYFVSFGYFFQDGIIKRTNYNRYTLRINTTMTPRKWFNIGENFQVSMSKRDYVEESNWFNSAVSRAWQADPITPVKLANGEYAAQVDGRGNPLARMQMGLLDQTSKNSKVVGSAFVEFNIFKGFYFKTTYGGEFDITDYRQFTPAYNFGVGDNQSNSSLTQNIGKSINWLWDNYLTYQHTFGINDITLLAGTSASEYQYYDISGYNAAYNGITPEEERYFRNFPRGGDLLDGSADQASQLSYLGRLNYKLLDRYLLTASIRRDGSSKFGDDNKWGTFPSFAVAWKVNNEGFMQNQKFISTLKLHAGWGKTGSDKIGTGRYTGVVTSNLNYSQGNSLATGATTLRPANPTIKWESNVQTNLGFDAGFLNNRILLCADYFVRYTEDMLCRVDPPLTSGIPSAQSPTLNIGKVRNKGLEITASYKKMEGDFKYEFGAFISRVVNKVIDIGGEDVRITPNVTYGQTITPLSVTQEGQPIASFYGYVIEGVFQNYDEINAHAHQSDFTQPGDFKFKDINGDTLITTDDQTFIGSPHPDYTYGGNISISYKFIDFSLTIQGVKGVDIFTPYKLYTHNPQSPNYNLSADLLDAWTSENHSNSIPRVGANDPNQNKRVSTYYIEDGSYLRLKTAQIGFTLPEKILTKVNISNARIYIGAQNLLTFTKYKGNDPEVGLSQRNAGNYNNLDSGNQLLINVDVGNTPQPRTFTIGFDLTF
jgi:TonB-dependent starch-binding outer membrane protein SusC